MSDSAVLLVVTSGVYKVSINPIIQSKTPSNNHTSKYVTVFLTSALNGGEPVFLLGYGLDGHRIRVLFRIGRVIFSSPCLLNRFCGSPNLLSNGYRVFIRREQSGGPRCVLTIPSHRCKYGPPLWSSGKSFWLQIQRSRFRFPALQDFLRSRGSGTEFT
jgi:hypothetical protein